MDEGRKLEEAKTLKMEAETFKNCSGFTDEQITAVALVRGITAGICGVVLFIVFVVLTVLAILRKTRARICGTVVKRLTTWLTANTVLYELILALSLVYYFNPSNVAFCVADGFLIQYVGSIQVLFTLSLSLTVFFKVCQVTAPWKPAIIATLRKKVNRSEFTCRGCRINKLEAVFLVSVLILPSLFDWIPFITSSYGPTGPWCWIRSIEKENCTENAIGQAEQIALWNVPFGLMALLTLVLFIAALCLLCCAVKNTKLQRLIDVGITDSVFSLSILAIMFVLCVLEVVSRTYSFKHQDVAFWIVYAVSTPLGRAFIPLALLVAIHLPLSSTIARPCCKRQKSIQGEKYLKTVHNSSHWSVINADSDTAWESPHSYTDEEEKFERTLRALVIDKEEGYGTIQA